MLSSYCTTKSSLKQFLRSLQSIRPAYINLHTCTHVLASELKSLDPPLAEICYKRGTPQTHSPVRLTLWHQVLSWKTPPSWRKGVAEWTQWADRETGRLRLESAVFYGSLFSATVEASEALSGWLKRFKEVQVQQELRIRDCTCLRTATHPTRRVYFIKLWGGGPIRKCTRAKFILAASRPLKGKYCSAFYSSHIEVLF